MDVLNHLKTAHAQYVIRTIMEIIMAKLVNKNDILLSDLRQK